MVEAAKEKWLLYGTSDSSLEAPAPLTPEESSSRKPLKFMESDK